MARIIDSVTDAFGDAWEVREWRPTTHGFDIAFGWPTGERRGTGGVGGARVVLTAPLADYLDQTRMRPIEMRLPIGRSTIKRLRRILGHHWLVDRAAWWESCAEDLSDMTIEEFCAKHDVSPGAVVNARHALFGPVLRAAGWWRSPDIAGILTSDRPRSEIAEDLGISVGSVGRLRWMIKEPKASETHKPAP